MGSSHSKSMLHQAQVKVLRKCETCKTDKDIYYKCEQCQVYMCKSCSIIHQQESSTHNIREIVSNQPKSVKQPTEIFRNCELCLMSIKAHYKCTKCQMYMCFKCLIIHQQLFHNTNSNTSFSSTERLACKIQKKESIVTFCYSCLMKPVCSKCIYFHKNHHLPKPEYQHIIVQGRLSKDLAFTSLSLMQIKKQEFENNLIFQNILAEVEQRENSTEINTVNYHDNTKLRENINAEQIKLKTNLEAYKSYTSHYKQILETLQSKLDAAIAGNEDNISFVLLVSLSSLPNFYFRKLLQLIENLVPNETMETVRSFGIKVEERKKQSNIKIELLMSYETNFTCINKIITSNNKKAFIIDFLSKHLLIMHINDNIIISNDLSVMAMDMSVTPSKAILLNFNKSDALHQLTDEGTKPFLSVTPYQVCICCVHVTKYNEIILGVEDFNTIKSLSEDRDERKTKLMIFGTDKKLKQSLEYDIYGQRLLTSPYRIKSNINNEILVIDKMSLYNGRVMALNREGKVRWIYKGHPQVNSDYNLFDPSDIVTSKVGQIIVTDHRNHALHVLSELGDLLTCESVKAKGILYPWSLDLDNSGQLWIGCHSHSKDKKTKLHIVVIH